MPRHAASDGMRLPAAPGRPAFVRIGMFLALALVPAIGAAERFTYLGTQPDGSELYVQFTPPVLRTDGRYQGWFRTVPKTPAPVTDEFGFERRYVDFIALNVADCAARRMGAAAMHYRDDAGNVVARFELLPAAVEYREVRPGTLGESMLTALCTPRPPPGKAPPSAASQSPYK